MTSYTADFFVPVIILHFITAISACLLNLLVIVTIWQTPALQTPSRVLLCSLSLTDLLVGAIAQPMAAFYYISAIQNWPDAFCVSWFLMTNGGYTIGITALFMLTSMSVDRCLAVKTMTKYKVYVTKRRTIVFSVLVWVTVLTMNVTGLHLFTMKIKYSVIVTIAVVLLIIIITSFFIAYFTLRRISRRVSSGLPKVDNGTSGQFSIDKYRHSLKTMAMVLALNLVVYIPVIIMITVAATTKVKYQIVYFQYFGFLITFNSTMNPLFYIWRMKDLREAVKVKMNQLKLCLKI